MNSAEVSMTDRAVGNEDPIVLVADDDPTIRVLARASLEKIGITVREAENGEQALAFVRSARPDVILLDVIMPKLDGFTVCRTIREIACHEHTPILMMTGLNDLYSIDKAYEVGATDFITKPINWIILGHRIRYMWRSGQTQKHLKESREKNRALLNAIPDLIFQIRKDGAILDCRVPKDFPSLFPNGELTGRNIGEVAPFDFSGPMAGALETGEMQVAEYTVKGPDDHLYYYESRVVVSGEDDVLAIVRDISRGKEAELRTRAVLKRFYTILSSLYAGVLLVGEDNRIEFANQAFCDLFDVEDSPAALRGLTSSEMLEKTGNAYADPVEAVARVRGIIAERNPVRSEEVPMRGNKTYLRDFIPIFIHGEQWGRLWHHLDITELKRAEERIKAALAEKEVLLREIHHRVKNNLASIISLARLQTEFMDDVTVLTAFGDFERRIRAMALVHEDLYGSADLSNINASSYITRLTDDIMKAYDRRDISVSLDIGPICLDIDTSIPCGVIITELLTNAVKYAFPKDRPEPSAPGIVVCFTYRDDTYTLTVTDNGVGLPLGYNINNADSLGLILVSTITSHQLRGRLDVRVENGTRYTISFPSRKRDAYDGKHKDPHCGR